MEKSFCSDKKDLTVLELQENYEKMQFIEAEMVKLQELEK